MSIFSWKHLRTVASACALSAGMVTMTGTTLLMSTTQAVAQEKEASKTLSTSVAKVLTEVYPLIQSEAQADKQEAIRRLDNLLASKPNMPGYDKATVYELRGSAKAQLDPPNYSGALRDFEQAIAQNELPQARTTQLRFFIAQLYFQEERYPEAIRLLEEYVRTTTEEVNANTYYLLCAAYYSTQNYRSAQSNCEQAIAKSTEPKKGYYDLLNVIYSELGNNSKRGDLLRQMINIWPGEKTYWEQLSGAYSQAGRDADAAAVLEVAYRAGLITDPAKIIALVQYYSLLENPYRGGVLLEKEMASGNVPEDKKNLELLAQMWNLSREQKKAIAIYEKTAAKYKDVELYYRLGQVYFADEQWTKSASSMTKAINAGGLGNKKIGDAWLLIGSARFNNAGDDVDKRESALVAFRRAAKYPASAKSANQWIGYINAIKNTECRQNKVEAEQSRLAIKDEIDSCRAILQLKLRGGIVDEERASSCQEYVANPPTVTIPSCG